MSEVTAQHTEEEYVVRLRNLSKRRDELNSRRAKVEVLRDQALREIESLQEEMKTLGTSPATIEQDVANLEKSLQEQLVRFEHDLGVFEGELVKAEKILEL